MLLCRVAVGFLVPLPSRVPRTGDVTHGRHGWRGRDLSVAVRCGHHRDGRRRGVQRRRTHRSQHQPAQAGAPVRADDQQSGPARGFRQDRRGADPLDAHVHRHPGIARATLGGQPPSSRRRAASSRALKSGATMPGPVGISPRWKLACSSSRRAPRRSASANARSSASSDTSEMSTPTTIRFSGAAEVSPGADDEDRAVGMGGHLPAHGTERQPREPAAAAMAEHQQRRLRGAFHQYRGGPAGYHLRRHRHLGKVEPHHRREGFDDPGAERRRGGVPLLGVRRLDHVQEAQRPAVQFGLSCRVPHDGLLVAAFLDSYQHGAVGCGGVVHRDCSSAPRLRRQTVLRSSRLPVRRALTRRAGPPHPANGLVSANDRRGRSGRRRAPFRDGTPPSTCAGCGCDFAARVRRAPTTPILKGTGEPPMRRGGHA